MNQKGISNILIVGTVVLLLVIAGGAGYYFIKDKLEQEGNNQGQGLNQNQEKNTDQNKNKESIEKNGEEEIKDNQGSDQQLIADDNLVPPYIVSPQENSILTLTSKGIYFMVYPSIENSIAHIYIWEGEEALFGKKPFRELEMGRGEGVKTIAKTADSYKDGQKYTFVAQTCLNDVFTQCGLWGNPIHFSIKKQNLSYQIVETDSYIVKVPEDWQKESEGVFYGNFGSGTKISTGTLNNGESLVDRYNNYYSSDKFIDFKEREIKIINGKTFYLLKAITGGFIWNIALISKNNQEFFEINLTEIVFDYDEEIFDTILNTFTIKN